ncbi:hypothetical protein NUW54_g6256 [Trametes sanguinea]|uniref:Uncharacterized protein n=1 Tax=Trametes sanguinea TaxID=158606 RepID=A0ACC1PSS9_9APHY|nr:hypothetical protein NUW54_g6256 [Trametes sanguinea]
MGRGPPSQFSLAPGGAEDDGNGPDASVDGSVDNSGGDPAAASDDGDGPDASVDGSVDNSGDDPADFADGPDDSDGAGPGDEGFGAPNTNANVAAPS